MGKGLPGFFGHSYLYSGGESSRVRFEAKAQKDGRLELRLAYGMHENRGMTVPVTVKIGTDVVRQMKIDMTEAPPLEHGMISLGTFEVTAGASVSVTLSAQGAGGHVHADLVQFLPVE